jgi:hypothetical protein
MTSGLQRWTLAAATLIAASACSKTETSSASPSASSTPAAAGKCDPGSYTHPEPHFCIVLPQGYAAGSVQKRPLSEQIPFDGPNDGRFMLAWVPVAQYESELEAIKKAAATEGAEGTGERGELPGGGYWYHVAHGSGIHQAEVLVKGKAQVFRCHVNALSDRIDKELAACKSLRAL